jgi:hypothetical protein
MRRGWRQIDMPAADKRTAIVNPNNDASFVTDLNESTER